MKKVIKFFIFVVVYPCFYYLDRHIIPLQNTFWHSYAQDLVMPGLIFLWLMINVDFFLGYVKLKTILIVGWGELFFGAYYEFRQYLGTTPGSENTWDVLCYALSITIGILILLLIKNDVPQEV